MYNKVQITKKGTLTMRIDMATKRNQFVAKTYENNMFSSLCPNIDKTWEPSLDNYGEQHPPKIRRLHRC